MASERRADGSSAADALRGAIAGGVAIWLMDLVTTPLLERQAKETTERELAARPHGRSSVDNLVARIETAAGVALDERRRSWLAQTIHVGLGVGPGAAYGLIRQRVPLLGSGRGLVYGLLLWVVNDEYLTSRLGLAASFRAYPAQTHFRGLVGHVVLGMATDAVIDVLPG